MMTAIEVDSSALKLLFLMRRRRGSDVMNDEREDG